MDNSEGDAFVDDSTLRRIEGGTADRKEAQADEWAEEALIPGSVWESSAVRDRPTPMAVVNLAKALQIHPAIIAGRVRYGRNNYRLLSQLVGTGAVRAGDTPLNCRVLESGCTAINQEHAMEQIRDTADGRSIHILICFSDINGFSGISRAKDTEEACRVLRRYAEVIAARMEGTPGHIVKYIG